MKCAIWSIKSIVEWIYAEVPEPLEILSSDTSLHNSSSQPDSSLIRNWSRKIVMKR